MSSPSAPSASRTTSKKQSSVNEVLTRISHAIKLIGASNQRKLLCPNDFCSASRKPQCRQSVAQNGLILASWKPALWTRPLMLDWPRRTLERFLLGAADLAIALVERFGGCVRDYPRQDLIEHEVVTLVRQRVFAIALGYEGLNDHDDLRHEPVMAVLAGKLSAKRADCAQVAGKSTLNRLGAEPGGTNALSQDRLRRSGDRPPAGDIVPGGARSAAQADQPWFGCHYPLHGHQEGRFFHGHYDCYCRLYVFCGRHILAARRRRSDIDASAGSAEEVARIVKEIRTLAARPHPSFCGRTRALRARR